MTVTPSPSSVTPPAVAAHQLPPLGSPRRDRVLLRAAALGDEAAWQQLVEDHAQRVWDVTRSAHLRAEEATAVCDLVWLRLVDQLPETDGLPLVVWLRRTATTESHLAYLRTHPGGAEGDRRRQERHTG